MIQRDIGKDTQLNVRMFITMLLLGLVYAGFLYFLFTLGAGVYLMLVFAIVMVGIQFYFSDKMILASMHAKVVTEADQPKLHEVVTRLSLIAGIPKPKVAISEMQVPNAFAAGRSTSKTTVAVTTGLLSLLSDRELEAVLAHEITHVKNKDVVVMTIASFFSVVASTLMSFFFWMSLFGGMGGRGGRGGGAGNYIMIAYMATIVVWVVSLLLVSALSRYREYSADRGAAIITGNPNDLATALTRISGAVQRVPKNDLRKAEKMNAFFIIPAFGDGIAHLFASHPPVLKRIEKLQQIQQSMMGGWAS
jgi:heat shock protein HtpX